MQNRVTQLFGIEYPLIQAGMIWCSCWELASAVSNAGGLGLIGAGSMYPDKLAEHIEKCQKATKKPFGVNIPLLYPQIDELMDIVIRMGVKIVFTSAGNPAKYTGMLKEKGITVVHVVSNVKFALKAQEAGCDAIVAEGFEAGGHNGREETTTMCLIPLLRPLITVPLLAAGGIASGRAWLAAHALGAEGVQVGTRFVASLESSAHPNFKQAVITAQDGDTALTLKELTPVRLLKNKFYKEVEAAYAACASKDQLAHLLGRARAKRGMFEGDLDEGELEIGEACAQIRDILPARVIVQNLIAEYNQAISQLQSL